MAEKKDEITHKDVCSDDFNPNQLQIERKDPHKHQALLDNSMISYIISKKTMEIIPKHSIVFELKKKISTDKSDKTFKDFIWFCFTGLRNQPPLSTSLQRSRTKSKL